MMQVTIWKDILREKDVAGLKTLAIPKAIALKVIHRMSGAGLVLITLAGHIWQTCFIWQMKLPLDSESEKPMTDSPSLKCPGCDGNKTIRALLHYASKPCEWKEIPCFTCKGVGEITEDHAKRIEKGKLIREDRLKRDLSQREEAKRLGMDVVEYSKLEHGQI